MDNFLKKNEKIIGFTSVVGDFLHAGHCMMLEECKKYCDFLYVGLIADPTIDRKEKNQPIESLLERYVQLKNNKYVDEIIPLGGEADLSLALQLFPIDIRFVGEDYKGKNFTGKDICEKLNIPIIYNTRKHNLSSSNIRQRMKGEV